MKIGIGGWLFGSVGVWIGKRKLEGNTKLREKRAAVQLPCNHTPEFRSAEGTLGGLESTRCYC